MEIRRKMDVVRSQHQTSGLNASSNTAPHYVFCCIHFIVFIRNSFHFIFCLRQIISTRRQCNACTQAKAAISAQHNTTLRFKLKVTLCSRHFRFVAWTDFCFRHFRCRRRRRSPWMQTLLHTLRSIQWSHFRFLHLSALFSSLLLFCRCSWTFFNPIVRTSNAHRTFLSAVDKTEFMRRTSILHFALEELVE